MKSINLFAFTRVGYDCATRFGNALTYSPNYAKVKEHEFATVVALVNVLQEQGLGVIDFDGFFFSYQIAQIGKEFDLLKVDPGHRVLNIELKSYRVEEAKILAQLRRNEYYLNHLGDTLELYTYMMETGELFCLRNNELEKVSFAQLADAMRSFTSYEEEDLQKYFTAQDYLISPVNDPDKFLEHKYFLTQNQEQIRDKIIREMEGEKPGIIGITGIAGTGKTLLLFDLINTLSQSGKTCCLIYSGLVPKPGNGLSQDDNPFAYLNRQWEKVEIIGLQSVRREDFSKFFSKFDVIAVDESQHIEEDFVRDIVTCAVSEQKKLIFAYDMEQIWSFAEEDRNIPELLRETSGFQEFKLSEKIRTSKELTSFCKNLLNLNSSARGYLSYENVEILYAKNELEAQGFLSFYEKQKDYIFISHKNTDDVVNVMGREFDRVMIVIDETFVYDEKGRIQDREQSGPDYSFWRLLYQGISRVREKLCVLVVNNYEMFEQVLDIKFRMLEKYQYQENKYSSLISPKSLNKKVRYIKGQLDDSDLNPDTAAAIYDAVIMIKDELTATKANNRIIKNGDRLLQCLLREYEMPAKLRESLEEIRELTQSLVQENT